MSEQLQEKNVRGLLSVIFYYNDAIYKIRDRNNVYESLENSTDDVDGNNILYDDKIKY